MSKICEVRCHLSVVGGSEEFSRELSDLWPSGKITHTKKGPIIWRLSGQGPFERLVDAVVYLLTLIDQFPDEFSKITTAHHSQQWITVAIDTPIPADMPDGHIPSEVLARMAHLGLSLDIDLQLPGPS